MKNYIVATMFLIVFTSAGALGQQKRLAYYDAMALDTLERESEIDSSKLKPFFDTLWQYSKLKDPVNIKDIDILVDKFRNNPFLYDHVKRAATSFKKYSEDYIKAANALSSKKNDRNFFTLLVEHLKRYAIFPKTNKSLNEFMNSLDPTGAATTLQSANNDAVLGSNSFSISSSSVSGALPWEANVIAGTTAFLAERFQDEISQYFLDRLRDALKQNPYFRHLFPSTYALIKVDGSAWAYGTMFELLKTSIQSDIQRMPNNLNQVILNVPPYDTTMSTSVPLQLLSDLLSVYESLQTGQHPADILDGLVNLQIVKNSKDTALTETVRLLSTVSGTLRDKQGSSHPWVSLSQVAAMTSQQKDYLSGLIFQLVKDDTIWNYKGHPYTLDSLAANIKSDQELLSLKQSFNNFREQFFEVVQTIQSAERKINDLKSKGDTSPTLYLNYVDAFLQVIEKSMDQKMVDWMPEKEQWQIRLTKYKLILFHTRQLLETYQQQSYGPTISHALIILQLCDTTWSKSSTTLFRYTAFLASIADAKNGDDVKNAISAAALPVGSYSIKRKAEFDMSVNSYVGGSAGFDCVSHEKSVLFAGVAAPIGVSISCGNHPCWIQSWSLHINLLDFGLPLSYSGRDSAGLPTNLQFKNLLALGGGVIAHIRSCPVSFGILGTYTPDIRDVAGVADKQSTWRAMFMVAVDIPIFDIYSRGE